MSLTRDSVIPGNQDREMSETDRQTDSDLGYQSSDMYTTVMSLWVILSIKWTNLYCSLSKW